MTGTPRGRHIGRITTAIAFGLVGLATAGGPAAAQSLTDAVRLAIETNPEIAQASAGREVVDHELTQARGRYLPQVDLDAFAGPQWTDNPFTRARGEGRTQLYPNQLSIVLQQLVFDGFGTGNEVDRQASRLDAAAYRVLETAELIGLDVVQAYLDVLRQIDLVRLANNNVGVHMQTLNDVRQRQRAGRSSIADVQQASERLFAAESTLVDFELNLRNARVTYERLVGAPVGVLTRPVSIAAELPIDVETAAVDAKRNSPVLLSARADLDTANAGFRAAAAPYYPQVAVEGRATVGDDLRGTQGSDQTYEVLLTARYNLFRGGIDAANRREELSRIRESRSRLLALDRSIEELVRQSWNELQSASRRLDLLEEQVASSEQVRRSYRQQFNIGQRTLLDLLDTENGLFNARVSRSTVDHALIFSRYRVIAATGNLLRTIGVNPPAAASSDARRRAGAPVTR